MSKRDENRRPRALSPTPLRDWVDRQPAGRRAGFVMLAAALLACGAKAAFVFDYSPVPATQQATFALLVGVLLGSRLACVGALAYLLGASLWPALWPPAVGPSPLTGPLAGYLWSLPLMAYLSGVVVERLRSERPVSFAIGVCLALACHDAMGSGWLLVCREMGAGEAFVKGAGFFVGQHLVQGGLAVLAGSSASNLVQQSG